MVWSVLTVRMAEMDNKLYGLKEEYEDNDRSFQVGREARESTGSF